MFVTDDQDRVLLIRRTDNGLWALPGGGAGLRRVHRRDRRPRDARRRPASTSRLTGLVGIYTNPNHVVEYSDGEVRQQFSICFRARYLGGEPTTSDESSEVRWIAREDWTSSQIHPSMRLRIDHGYERDAEPYIG